MLLEEIEVNGTIEKSVETVNHTFIFFAFYSDNSEVTPVLFLQHNCNTKYSFQIQYHLCA